MDLLPTNSVQIYDDDHFYMASVLAEHIALAGLDVSYTTAQPVVAGWTDFTLEQDRIIARLNALNVPMHVNTPFSTLQSGTVLHVGHRAPNDGLFGETRDLLGEENVTLCGDALVPGTIQAAVHSGHRIRAAVAG